MQWLLWVLMLCLAGQGFAVGARRVLGPAHYHESPVAVAAVAWAQDLANSQVQAKAQAPALHDHAGIGHHRHARGAAGLVMLDRGSDADSGERSDGLARLLSLAQQTLDLPAALPLLARIGSVDAAVPWPASGVADFGSRSTRPPLRPPRGD